MPLAVKPQDDLRRAVLDASLALIERDGLASLSMREVARRAGVSHQAPYHHFGDREGILAAISAEGFELLRESTLLAIEGRADPVEKLSAIGRAYVNFAINHPAHFKLMFRSEFVTDDRHEILARNEETAFAVLVSVMQQVAAPDINDRTLSLMAWALAHGLATLLIEGKFKHQVGDDAAARAAVEDVLDRFVVLVRGVR